MKIELKNEIKRKLFHLTSLIFPFFLLILPITIFIKILFILFIIILILDYYKIGFKLFHNIPIFNWLPTILREDEKMQQQLTGTTYLIISVLIVTVLSKKTDITILSLLVLILCDISSAIIGIAIGKIKLVGDKTLEGSIAFLIIGILLVLFFNKIVDISTISGIIAIIFTTFAELYSKKIKINDNLLIPIVFLFVYELTICLIK